MKPAVKKILIACAFLLLGVLVANLFISRYIKKTLTENKDIQVRVHDVDVNILTRSIVLHQVMANSNSGVKDSFNIEAKSIVFSGISLKTIFNGEKAKIGNIAFLSPNVSLYKGEATDNGPSGEPSKPSKNKLQELLIGNLQVKALSVRIFDIEKTVIAKAAKIDAGLKYVLWRKSNKKSVPISYADILVQADSTYYRPNRTEELQVRKLRIDDNNIAFYDLGMKTKYDREELQKNIRTQRDWVALSVPKIELLEYMLKEVDGHVSFSAKELKVNKPDLKLYRFKGLPENTMPRPLYSKILRDLPFYLNIDAVNIQGGQLDYSERLEHSRPSGNIGFSELRATIANLHNRSTNKDTTKITIKADFMDQAPIALNWDFQVNDADDAFLIRGRMKNLDISKTNSYMEPVLNVKSQGKIDALYFTLTGNETEALGDVKMEYQNLKISVLDSEKGTIRKFLTKAVNLIIKTDNPKTDAKEKHVKVQREPNRSFFNYFWKCIQKGTLESAL